MDILVIGGGPAGVAAAITGAIAGYSVCLVAKSAREFHRPEDEPLQSVHPGLESLLKLFGAENAVNYSSRGKYTGIQQNHIFKPLSTNIDETWHGHHISPGAFRKYLNFRLRCYSIKLI